jgi:hypothetical protein
VHTILVSAANVHDREALPYLLHGHETRVWGDQGYQGQSAVIHARAPNAKDFTNRRYRYHGRINEVEKAKNRNKSRVRAKVEHVFGVIKNIFGFRKTRYRGLAPAGSDRCTRQPVHRPTTIAEGVGDVSVEIGKCTIGTRKLPSSGAKPRRFACQTQNPCRSLLS